jgi:tRNA (guanine26-N2/guanine27-N2)-dimethyltransferase
MKLYVFCLDVSTQFLFGAQALRLVLHSMSTSASRYGRYIQPLLSLSIDFYVRIFVRVQSAAIEVKKSATWVLPSSWPCVTADFRVRKTSTYYICTGCQSFYGQPLGKMTEKVHERSGNVNYLFKTHSGPSVPVRCPECNFTLHVSGVL